MNRIIYNELVEKIEKLEKMLNGGEGSGNFGHAGRPGKVGGSSKGFPSEKMIERLKQKWGKRGVPHPEMGYIIEANRNNQHYPPEVILADKTLQEISKRADFDKDTLEEHKDDPEREKMQEKLEDDLLDDNVNGSAVRDENGKIKYKGEVKRDKEAVFVIGRPAGGKSSVFADPYSEQLKARIIDSDTVKKWLPEFDEGYGAGRVQNESALIAERALAKSVERGENIIIPKIGGNSVEQMARELKAKGYKVSLCYNEVSEATSIQRAASRCAETGRYLDVKYLKSIGDKAQKTFERLRDDSDLFDYAVQMNNDVPFGQKPTLVWERKRKA